MPFLIPAITALISDSTILWLNRLLPYMNDIDDDDSILFGIFSIYNVRYVAILGGLRLLILILPLLFHSYTGTAVKYTLVYQCFYTITLLILIIHIISLALLNPSSIETMVPILIHSGTTETTPSTTNLHDDDDDGDPTKHAVRRLMCYAIDYLSLLSTSLIAEDHDHDHRLLLVDHFYELRRIWWMLTLSIISICCHWILLWHVRSTAPPHYYFGYKKPSVYFAVRTASSYAGHHHSMTQLSNATSTNNNSPLTLNTNRNRHNSDEDGVVNEQAMIHAMNEFIVDMQSRLQRARSEWAGRLEDFGNLIANSSPNIPALSGDQLIRTTSSDSTNSLQYRNQQQSHSQATMSSANGVVHGSRTTTHHQLFPSTVQPFRILLQLFAYEDVLENRRLDSLFDMDNGQTITFFVPQILSFLLHGALYSSPLLEEWLLEKCRRNIYFAHRCYWFLRAWCLEAPAEIISSPYTRSYSNQSIDIVVDDGIGLAPFLDEPAASLQTDDDDNDDDSDTCNTRNFMVPSPISTVMKPCHPSSNIPPRTTTRRGTTNSNPPSKRNSRIFHTSSNSSLQGLNNSDKFLPEERAMIERLMMRVKECGEIPARQLEFGNHYQHPKIESTDENNILDQHVHEKSTNRRKASVTSEGSWEDLEVDPNNVSDDACEGLKPTHAKVDTEKNIRSELPIIDGEQDESRTFQTQLPMSVLKEAVEMNLIPSDPFSGMPSIRHYQAITVLPRYGFLPFDRIPIHENAGENSSPSRGVTEHFDKSPQFLDALIFLAESLFLVPREARKEALRQQLRALECELLPSNSIYLPLGGNRVHHSVWRVAVDECIPISTKERVPCIVTLEVVDFTATGTRPLSRENSSVLFSGVLDNIKNNHNEQFDMNHTSQSPHAMRAVLPDADNFDSHHQVGLSAPDAESKALYDWIHASRHPFRRTSLLDKVTTSVSVPFAKMKTHVRDHFLNNLRSDRKSVQNVTEEMQPLASSQDDDTDEYVDNQKKLPFKKTSQVGLDSKRKIDVDTIDQGTSVTMVGFDLPISADSTSNASTPERCLSRMGSDGSLVSLGQWSSPYSSTSKIILSADDNAERKKMWSEIKRRLNDNKEELPPKPQKRKNACQLPYGSDHEEDTKDVKISTAKAMLKRRSSPIQSTNRKTTERNSMDVSNQTHLPPPIVFRESWAAKQERIRLKSAFGNHPGWKLIPILIKANDDLRQEQLACQLIQRMASILASEKVNSWLYPYEIIALTDSAGLIEAIPDTISLDSLKKNGGRNYKSLNGFFISYFGNIGSEELAGAKANFVESLAAYSIICFLLQIKDRHNGNILLDNKGHLIHIDFGFFFLSSPGKNVGFESAPFKLTREFVEVLDGSPDSHLFRTYRSLCIKTFMAIRRRCMEIILLVEMLKVGNEELPCFRGRPDDAIQQLRERFRLDLNDRACTEYVNSLIDDSIENWRTDWYDRYQRYFVGVL